MPAQVPIFDRTMIVNAIESDCLSPSGRGTLIFSPQKSGKSYLMRHIHSLTTSDDAIFCWINMDLMRAKAATPPRLTDRDFLRYMLKRLAEEIENKILESSPNEPAWKADLLAARAQIGAPAPAGSDPMKYRELVAKTVQALEAPLNALNTLRIIADRVKLWQNDSDTGLIDLFDDCMDQLQAAHKRVILFIDDFHYVLKQADFSASLKFTLRGANSEGRLVLLLSSAIRLMDPSVGRGGKQDIGTVFNDLKLQVLEPFNRELSLEFLDWLGKRDGQTLSGDEKSYLCELGGGSPQFLEIAMAQYVGRRPRPLSQEQRTNFETNVLYPAFEAGFAQIWSRCTTEQRRACRELLKSGNAPLPTTDLGAAGCFMAYAAANERVSRLASRFISLQKDDGMMGFAVTPQLNFESFPSALCLSMPKEVEALVTFQLDNSTSDPVEVQLTCLVEQFSLEASENVVVAPYESRPVEMKVALMAQKAAQLNIAENTQVKVTYAAGAPGAPAKTITKTFFASILEKDYFVIARRHTARKAILNCAWLIAAWVNREDKSVIELRAEAARLNKGALAGYPKTESPAAAKEVEAQAKALYNALFARNLNYGNRTLPPYQDANSFGQTVRLPGKSIGDNMMNCLDGAVLFASLLASCDLDPGILFVPGHALVGWRHSHSPAADWEFLEITDVAGSDFSTALTSGRQTYAGVQDTMTVIGDPKPVEMKDVEKAAVLVDIRSVWAAGVKTLPA